MNSTRASIIKGAMITMGILGYLVLLLPWYELTSSVHGYGYSSSYNAGSQSGFVAAGATFFGYGLYALPGALIAVAMKNNMLSRTKALILEFIGVGELLCMLLVNQEMGSFDTDLYSSGISAHAGFDIYAGYYLAWAIYVVTGIVGLIMCFVAPKPDVEEAELNTPDEISTTFSNPTATSDPAPAKPLDRWICVYCETENVGNYRQCKLCGLYKDFKKGVTGTKEEKEKKIPSEGALTAEIVGDMKICPTCKREQKADRRVCWYCNQKFDN